MAGGSSVTAAFAGAVLTGGRSSRMGRDKALIEVDGSPMAVRVARVLAAAGAEPVLAIGGDGDALERLGMAWQPDRFPGEGPLGGLLTAFGALSGAALVAVAATDLPALTAPTVSALVGALADHDVAVAMTDRPEPLCALWRAEVCEPVLAGAFAAGERAVHLAMAPLDRILVAVAPGALRNINEPDDLGR